MARKPSDQRAEGGHYNPALSKLRDKAAKKLPNAYKYAPKQEKKLATKLALHRVASRVPGSGAGKKKGDVQVNGIARIEAKATSRKSFSITRDMIDKITDGAGATNEVPIIQVDFLDPKGKLSHSCAVVPMYVLERLIAEAEE